MNEQFMDHSQVGSYSQNVKENITVSNSASIYVFPNNTYQAQEEKFLQIKNVANIYNP